MPAGGMATAFQAFLVFYIVELVLRGLLLQKDLLLGRLQGLHNVAYTKCAVTAVIEVIAVIVINPLEDRCEKSLGGIGLSLYPAF